MTTTTLTGDNGTTVTIEYSELPDETSEGTIIANVTVTAAMGHTLSELFLEIPSGIVDGDGNNLQHSLGYSIDGGETIVSSYNEGLWPPGSTSYTFQLVATKDIDFSDFGLAGELLLTPFIGLDDSSIYDEFDSVEVPVAEEVENLAPTDIALTAATVAETVATDSVVGLFSATDSDTDAGDLAFTLDDDAGGLFRIETVDGETRLVVNGALDFETSATHEVTVEVSDGENTYAETFTINVTDAVDIVEGTPDKDSLKGTAGVDVISGFKGNDKLDGLAGADTLVGGKGIDKLHGGADGDLFVFAKGDTGKTRAAADTIHDFLAKDGDKIDLSDWDANEKKSGDQDFTFIGGQNFHGKAGELRFVKEKSDTWVIGDTDGDRKADFLIHLDDAMKLKLDHFDLQ